MDLTTHPPVRFDPFHLGLFTCAFCAEGVTGQDRVSHELPDPLIVKQGVRQAWIPAGRQSFHQECFEQLPEQVQGRGLA